MSSPKLESKEKERQKSVDSGFDYDHQRDSRNVHHKGKHSYNTKELLRIHYIKQKKEKQKEEQSRNSLFRFHSRIIHTLTQ